MVQFAWLAEILATMIVRIKGLGFLEWAGIASMVDTILTYDVKQQAFKIIAEEFANRAGLVLDENDPFSEASIAGAVSQKIGFPVRSLRDPVKIKEDLDAFMAAQVSERSGYVVRSVVDVDVLRQDLQRAALATLSEQVGIPLGQMPEDGDALNSVVIRERVLLWAKAQLLVDLNDGVAMTVGEIMRSGTPGVLADYINTYGHDGKVSEHGVALVIADRMATAAIADWQKAVSTYGKRQRRQESLRRAQAKFRRLHGNRQKYVPLGMTASVD